MIELMDKDFKTSINMPKNWKEKYEYKRKRI